MEFLINNSWNSIEKLIESSFLIYIYELIFYNFINTMKKNLIVYIIAFLEWFTTLAVEVFAIRKAVPLVWNNIVITSIILWIIILALSLWYYFWWIYSQNLDPVALSKKLRNNLLISALYYCFISFLFENILLEKLIAYFDNYVLAVFIMALILFFIPVYLASQTVPLLTEIHKGEWKWITTGKILFYSTLGSFLWSIVPVIVLLPFLGLAKSIFVIWFLLCICAFALQFCFIWWFNYFLFLISWGIVWLFFTINTNAADQFETLYQNILIYNSWNYRVMSLDGSFSSAIDMDTWLSPFNYIKEALSLTEQVKPKSILVLWAAWFTYPQSIASSSWLETLDVVDIDGALYDIAQNNFYKKPLDKKINFIPQSGRYFINECIRKWKKYDLIFVDVYNGKMNIPSEFLTKEYFDSLNKIWDVVISNIILDPLFRKDFSKNLLNTIFLSNSQIFYKNVSLESWEFANFLFSNKKFTAFGSIPYNDGFSYYTDDKNDIEKDKYNFFY